MDSRKSIEELLNEHKNWKYVKTDRNDTYYFLDCTCPRCGGAGKIAHYHYIDGGVCYECGGSGVTSTPETIKIYTPEYEEKLANRRKERAEKAAAERIQKALAERETNLQNHGFGKDENGEWVVYRVLGDTYSIKDTLKSLGCKFNGLIGWYSNMPLADYECQKLTEREVLQDSPFIIWKDKKDIEPLLVTKETENPSKWQGEIGTRIEIDVVVNRTFGFDGQYGTNFMHIMQDKDGNIYKWTTSKWLEEKASYHLRATVKDHTDYKGIKQTVITRASVIA